MIEDLQDDLTKYKRKNSPQTTFFKRLFTVLFPWMIIVIIAFVICLPSIKKTFKNKTLDLVFREAADNANYVETRTMTLFYVDRSGNLQPVVTPVPITGDNIYYDAVEGLLLSTPQEAVEKLCISYIPKGTNLESITVKDTKAIVVFSKAFDTFVTEDPGHNLARAQILNTIQAINPAITELTLTY